MLKKLPVTAAGGVVWKKWGASERIAIVYRNRYEDWTLPKGKCNPGESIADAAVREVQEEIGHEVRLKKPIARTHHSYDRFRKTTHFFQMSAQRQRFPIDRSEVVKVRWVSPKEAIRRIKYDDQQKVISKAIEMRKGEKRHV